MPHIVPNALRKNANNDNSESKSSPQISHTMNTLDKRILCPERPKNNIITSSDVGLCH